MEEAVKLRVILATTATLALSVACTNGYQYSQDEDGRFVALGPPAIESAELAAEIPGFVTTDGPATLENFEEPGFQQVTVTRSDGNRQAMGILFLEQGDLSNPVFTDIGRTTTFSLDRPTEPTEQPIVMSIVNCGGDPSDSWYDAPADDTTVIVEEGPEPQDRVVTIESISQDGAMVESTFVLTR
jgi:hypothetical protein